MMLGHTPAKLGHTPAKLGHTPAKLGQTLLTVFDYRQPDQASWSLKQLFGIGASPACPLAATSAIYIDTTGTSTSSSTEFQIRIRIRIQEGENDLQK
jgi:hypothetical protein